MNDDIRLKLSFQTHPKTKKLRLKLGNDGVVSFIWLLMFAAANKPSGILTKMDQDDIALAADYQGDPDQFVEVLLAIRFLVQDEENQCLKIKDWDDHNAWAAKAEQRSEQARKAAARRWNAKRGLDKQEKEDDNQGGPGTEKQQLNEKNDAAGIDQQCDQHTTAMQSLQNSNAPIPTPTPTPTPIPNPIPIPKPVVDIPSTIEREPEPAGKAAAGFQVEREKRDYSKWVPDLETIDIAKHRCPGITKQFVQEQLDEFRIYAREHYRPDQLNTRFYKQLVRQWKHREIKKSEEKTRSTFTIPKDTNQIMAWASENGYPLPWPGEETPQYRTRLERLLEERSREVTH